MSDAHKRFEAMVDALSADIYRYAFWLCRDHAVAEDLVQETFTRAWRSLEQLRDDRKAKSWLMTTVRREHARRFERYQPSFDDVEPDQISADDSDRMPSVEVWQLRRALGQLPRKYREPLVLQVIGGYTSEEIAEMLELSPSAVMTRLFRARQQLRNLMGDDENPRMVQTTHAL